MKRGSLRVEAVVRVGERDYEAELVYPALFPTSPASVFPLDRKSKWSVHQYQGGELCLEWGPDNWHPGVTGADLLESLYRLLGSEDAEAIGLLPVPSRHRISVGQSVRTSWRRFILDWSSQEVLAGLEAGTCTPAKFRIRWLLDPLMSLAYLEKLGPVDEAPEWTNAVVPGSVMDEGYALRGFVLVTPQLPPPEGTLEAESLRAALESWELARSAVDANEHLGFLWVDGAGTCSFGTRIGDATSSMDFARTIVLAEPDLSVRMEPEFATLDDRSVAVVGLGSVGSKIAESLARAGVGRFLLIDDDLMLPDNLVRHARDWRDVGLHKADAVAQGDSPNYPLSGS